MKYNKDEFEQMVREKKLVSHDKATVACEEPDCDIIFDMQVFKIRRKIRKYGKILCPSHCMKSDRKSVV